MVIKYKGYIFVLLTNKITIMRLERKIHTTNEINRIGFEVTNQVLPQLRQLVGVKIFLRDGSKSKKFIIDTPTIEPNSFNGEWAKNHGMYFQRMGKSLYLTIRLSFSDGGGGSIYEEKTNYLGLLDDDGQILVEVIEDVMDNPKAYSFDEVKNLLSKKEELEKSMRDLKSQLGVFADWW